MLPTELVDLGVYLGFIVALGLPIILLKALFDLPFEVTRKLYHLIVTLSIFPLVKIFDTWYMAVLAVFMLALMAYPALALIEHSSLYKRIAVERGGGEFKQSLIVVQVSMALLLFVFWGLLGDAGKYIAIVAVMAWGFGDAAAALVGKTLGRRRVRHPLIKGTKTYEGTLAMFIVAGLAIFFTLLIEAGHPWQMSLTAALIVAPVCALVELFSNRGMDTLTVPISTGLAVLSFVSLYSILGG